MRAAAILLALVFVLGLVSAARGQTPAYKSNSSFLNRDELSPADIRVVLYGVRIGKNEFGFEDVFIVKSWQNSWICLGPLGTHQVPFTGKQGLFGLLFVFAVVVALPVYGAVRRRKRIA